MPEEGFVSLVEPTVGVEVVAIACVGCHCDCHECFCDCQDCYTPPPEDEG